VGSSPAAPVGSGKQCKPFGKEIQRYYGNVFIIVQQRVTRCHDVLAAAAPPSPQAKVPRGSGGGVLLQDAAGGALDVDFVWPIVDPAKPRRAVHE